MTRVAGLVLKARVVGFGRDRICFGIAPSENTGGWVVWVALDAPSLNRLSAWETRELAEAALCRYVDAARAGYDSLIQVLDVDEAGIPGFLPPQGFTEEEAALVRATIHSARG